jgi:hypothetical protein
MKTIYQEKAEQIGNLVSEKNAAYGSAFAQAQHILKVLYPNGIKPEQYTDALATIRVIDKLFRIANNKDAFGESPWQDIAGYAILGVVNGVRQDSKSESLSSNLDKEMVKPTKKITKRR